VQPVQRMTSTRCIAWESLRVHDWAPILPYASFASPETSVARRLILFGPAGSYAGPAKKSPPKKVLMPLRWAGLLREFVANC
jgi:hypothetical protein